MLKFDPLKRITVEEALQHPYLKDFHLPDEEPVSEQISRFDFQFEEKEEIDNEELRKCILDEILLYHDNKHYENYIFLKKEYIEKENKEMEERTAKEMERRMKLVYYFVIFRKRDIPLNNSRSFSNF